MLVTRGGSDWGKEKGRPRSEVKQLEEDLVVRGRSQQAILERQKVGKCPHWKRLFISSSKGSFLTDKSVLKLIVVIQLREHPQNYGAIYFQQVNCRRDELSHLNNVFVVYLLLLCVDI